ncbi:MAG: hypothetical protein J2P47_09900 [Acetobacteraceae bacterium]|nr:hypothetical protein [Acetobacteraceae bacterium]
MAEQTRIVTETETPEAFVADRERFWVRFTHMMVGTVIAVALVLLGMLILIYF